MELSPQEHAKEFFKVLREHSVHKDDPIPEWSVVDSNHYATHCICKHYIQNIFIIQNKITGKRLDVGSDCIKKWSIEFNLRCRNCRSILGNKEKRLMNNDLICPQCKRKADKLDLYTMFWTGGPWHGLFFKDVVKNKEWVDHLINVDFPSSKTLQLFKEYCVTSGSWEIQDEGI